MGFIENLLVTTVLQVWVTFTHNWPYLLISVVIAIALKRVLSPDKVREFLVRSRGASVLGATAAAVATPLCSCGTTAVILGMMANTVPWAPIIAFMVASPLTSPQELFYSAGLFGWPFAVTFFIASIALGLLGGLVGEVFERRGWLANQARFAPQQTAPIPASAPQSRPASAGVLKSISRLELEPVLAGSSACCAAAPARPAPAPAAACGCTNATASLSTAGSLSTAIRLPVSGSLTASGSPNASGSPTTSCACAALPPTAEAPTTGEKAAPPTLRELTGEFLSTGRRLLFMFLGFAFIGYLLNGLIPAEWVALIFGGGNAYSVPLAATLGLPLYINSEGSLPLVRAMIENGMSQGAALAFLITGAGTSIGAFTGMLTIARWRVIAIVVGTLWVGAVITGVLFDLMLVMNIF